ncbi:PIN domain-containing protein [Pseudorhizobium endolithicum]|uniref:PIN domain-containing protein n=1 Tax=Pseudorhizobium endolithicum TaxID=1191678 RepID=A0ABN7JRD3_9HYPH|nr:type II toxin-antitoxin system VapC family toxin [Pseudorhizobium endolithicum]CAD6408882.1 PIN domain-containing protein [Rhizobium sp. Q54]CAD7041400.1 PIN domain-containing protein [Pseudorhizobium endolithicum]
MIGIDTNVLLRFLMKDDPKQHASAAEFFRARSSESPAYISLFVFAEACWVMSRSYGFKNQQIATVFLGLLDSREVVFEDPALMREVFSAAGLTSFDVADYLVAEYAKRAGCLATVTFDIKAARTVPGMELLT